MRLSTPHPDNRHGRYEQTGSPGRPAQGSAAPEGAPGAVAGERIQRVLRGRADASGRSLAEVTAEALGVQSIKRFVDLDAIAALALFLASDNAKSISVQTIAIDGGSQAAQRTVHPRPHRRCGPARHHRLQTVDPSGCRVAPEHCWGTLYEYGSASAGTHEDGGAFRRRAGMTSGRHRHRPVVTLAALYGAGGSVVGPKVAQRLSVPLLDRAIPETVAKQTGLSEDAVADIDDQPRSAMQRLVASLGRSTTASGGAAGSVERLDMQERSVRARIEEFLARSVVSGGVAVGRGGMVILQSVPWALHVYLGGPREARLRQRMAQEGIDQDTAERRQRVEDRTRIEYVRRAYGVDGADPQLYHLMIDSTAVDLDTCVDLIVTASQARVRAAAVVAGSA
jgi:cytidylate kinase-like protein